MINDSLSKVRALARKLTGEGGSHKYKVGVAFSGGGSRGFAHCGALLALENAGIRPQIVAGVSAGSVVSTLYAAGMRPQQIVEIFTGFGFTDFVEFKGIHQGGIFSLLPFGKFIENAAKVKYLEELGMTNVVCASDFDSGQPKEFRSGRIKDVIAASCCIPILFNPVVIDGVRYVDGGVLRNLPAWPIRKECDLLIGVNCSPLTSQTAKSSITSNAFRTYQLMAKTNVAEDMAMCDFTVNITEIAHQKTFDLDNIRSTVKAGYAAMADALRNVGIMPLSPDSPPAETDRLSRK